MARHMEGVEELAELSLTETGEAVGLLTVGQYCLKSICHLGAVEPVITMRYPLFHSDNWSAAFSVRSTARPKGGCPSTVYRLPTWLPGSLSVNCPILGI